MATLCCWKFRYPPEKDGYILTMTDSMDLLWKLGDKKLGEA